MDHLTHIPGLELSIQELQNRYDELQSAYAAIQASNHELKETTNLLSASLLAKEAKEKKYNAIIENSPGALFLTRTDGTILEANRTACEMLGYSEEEFRQLKGFGIVDLADTAVNNFLDERHQNGRARAEVTVIKKNGERLLVDASSFVFKDPSNGEDRVSAVMLDITDQKETEEALRSSNERYVYATKATFDAIWDWDIINDHLYWGEGYEKIFGYKISSKIDNHIHSFNNIHPEDRKKVFDGIDQLIASDGVNWTGEYRYKRLSGEYVFVQDKAIIIRDENGKAIRMIGAMQDISERRKAEDRSRRSQEKFDSLVSTVDGIVWEADAVTFNFTYVSQHAEKLLGYPLEQWSEKSFWANHIHPDDRSWVIDLCAGYTRVKKEHQFEYRMIANDGRTVWLADFVTVVVEKNKPVQLRGIMVDITARKKAEEELHERNSQLKQLSKHLQNVREEERKYLAREVHDELGQLAAVVKMDIDWLQIKMPDVESAPKKRIEHALSTTNLLINTIRKIASDLRPGMLDELGLNASLECECEKFKAANGIDCVFESTIDDSRVGSQAKTELYRICQESLHNVLRHAEASHITVSLNEGSGTIEMHIRDNGKGFDTQAKTTNHGLMGIAERSFSINGILNISSVIGKGTVVSIIIPKSN